MPFSHRITESDTFPGRRHILLAPARYHECHLRVLHQHRGMCHSYRVMTNFIRINSLKSLLAPVAAGYSAHSQGWPWIFWWCSILLAINLLLFIFCYEETKYMVVLGAEPDDPRDATIATGNDISVHKDMELPTAVVEQSTASTFPTRPSTGNPHLPVKSYWQRITHISRSPGSLKIMLRHTYQPIFILATFPAAAYTALQYGTLLSWYSVIAVTQTEYFAAPPYNFNTAGIGLLSLPPFIGCVFGAVYSGPFSDWSIQWFSKRNNNIYEPEMRLYIAILPVLAGPAGLFLYGYSLSRVRLCLHDCLTTDND